MAEDKNTQGEENQQDEQETVPPNANKQTYADQIEQEVEEPEHLPESLDAASIAESEARKVEANLAIKRIEMEQFKAQQDKEQFAHELQANLDEKMAAMQEQAAADERTRRAEAAARREGEKQRTEQHKLQLDEMKFRWSVERIRGQVSLFLIVGFLVTTLIVVGANIVGQAETDLLQTVSTLYSGITGAVLGYYFGRQQQ